MEIFKCELPVQAPIRATLVNGKAARRRRKRETQLRLIRDLMLAAARRGAWLTLGEISQLTEIGEASISAQLRHLRKEAHGGHHVEKRWRGGNRNRVAQKVRPGAGDIAETRRWEYRVLVDRSKDTAEGGCATQAPEGLDLLPNGIAEEIFGVSVAPAKTSGPRHRKRAKRPELQQSADACQEASDAEARP